MKLVQEGKLSPEDAAELIDAFQTGEEGKEAPVHFVTGRASRTRGATSFPISSMLAIIFP